MKKQTYVGVPDNNVDLELFCGVVFGNITEKLIDHL